MAHKIHNFWQNGIEFGDSWSRLEMPFSDFTGYVDFKNNGDGLALITGRLKPIGYKGQGNTVTLCTLPKEYTYDFSNRSIIYANENTPPTNLDGPQIGGLINLRVFDAGNQNLLQADVSNSQYNLDVIARPDFALLLNLIIPIQDK
ncbi:hypothetical protein GSH19_05180 [Lactobacillus sp. S2-2]|uniref:hypothetical protein n=1 Tax=Lactobacillus sp. S2-2 TaxID=2692917 RepID=UPI001F3D375A|nr:hypothetical protein [Lactobacillus sp. S2-2]MCF6515545.1 hypothetical protein [Lactobacillus sp. S2-2]